MLFGDTNKSSDNTSSLSKENSIDIFPNKDVKAAFKNNLTTNNPKNPNVDLQTQYAIIEMQDSALHSLSESVKNIKKQASLISEESKYQLGMLSDLTDDVNTLNAKTDAVISKVKEL